MSLFDRIRKIMSHQSNAVYQLEGEAGRVLEALREVNDPELNVNIVDLGLIRSVTAVADGFEVEMTLTTRGCPVGPVLVDEAQAAGQRAGYAVDVALVWDPVWSVDDISEAGKKTIDDAGS